MKEVTQDLKHHSKRFIWWIIAGTVLVASIMATGTTSATDLHLKQLTLSNNSKTNLLKVGPNKFTLIRKFWEREQVHILRLSNRL